MPNNKLKTISVYAISPVLITNKEMKNIGKKTINNFLFKNKKLNKEINIAKIGIRKKRQTYSLCSRQRLRHGCDTRSFKRNII